MKKILLIALAIVSLQVTAQERHHGKHDKMQAFKDMTAEEVATLHTKKMTLHLDLNDKQQKEIYAINLKNAENRKAFMEKRQAAKDNGTMQKPSKEERVKMMNAKLDHQIEMKNKMKSILNEEQFAKWEKAQARQHMKKEGMKKGPDMKPKRQ